MQLREMEVVRVQHRRSRVRLVTLVRALCLSRPLNDIPLVSFVIVLTVIQVATLMMAQDNMDEILLTPEAVPDMVATTNTTAGRPRMAIKHITRKVRQVPEACHHPPRNLDHLGASPVFVVQRIGRQETEAQPMLAEE